MKGFDVRLFFVEIPSRRFTDRWHTRCDFGPSRFGRTPGFWGLGRRVDVLGRSPEISSGEDPARTLSEYLASRKKSARHLREKAAVLLYPPGRLGEIVWKGRCRSGEEWGGLAS